MYAEKKDHWKDFAQDARRMGSPLYAVLAEAIDGDDELKALTEGSREGQPQANLLLAAVHFLLLRGARHLLREYYPTLGGTRTGAEFFPCSGILPLVMARRCGGWSRPASPIPMKWAALPCCAPASVRWQRRSPGRSI